MTEFELRNAFENHKASLAAMGDFVTTTIIAELEQQLGSKSIVEKFFQIPPKPRVKETDSFLEKALVRKPKDNPMLEITDQVGVRFVVLLLEDINRIGNIVQSDQWEWKKDRDHDRERLENPDYFAYQSDHYVVRAKKDIDFKGVIIPSQTPCEIQIRTILQHAYAEMAHSSDYKPSVHLPEEDRKKVKRSLAKGSALIETTDDVFKEIKNRLHEYNRSIEALLARSNKLYFELTGENYSSPTALGLLIADTYRELLKAVTPDQLTAWTEERPWLGERLTKKRANSVFYRDPVVVLLGWLITENEMAIPKRWPVDSSYLENFYETMGLSTNSLF